MRVLTLNIWARFGPYDQREPVLRRELAMLAPDVAALQEVDVAPADSNQAEELLDGLGYQVAYERREGESGGAPGLAVASRHPIEDRRVKELGEDGVALATRIRIGEQGFWFCCAVPMSWIPGHERDREEKTIALDAWLTELAAGDSVPPVLAGDFDATPDSSSIRFLTGLQSLGGASTYWIDAFAVAGDGSPGYTWSTDNHYVAPLATAVFAQPVHRRRIDYIFVGSPFRWSPRTIVRSAAVVMTGRGGVVPSDHYGVMADLELDAVAIGGGRGLESWPRAKESLWRPTT